MPRIEQWSVVVGEINPYMAPEQVTQHLHGRVYDHPDFQDGELATTSRIVGARIGKEGDFILTYSGREYALGEVSPEYEARFPGAEARLINSLAR
jgi:hypothetical protein